MYKKKRGISFYCIGVEDGNSNDAPQYMLCIIIRCVFYLTSSLVSIYKYTKNLKNINLK